MIVINLFNLSARLTLDDESFSRGIQNATQQGEQAGQSVEGIGSRFKNLAKTIAGLAIVKKVADITTSIVKLGIDG